MKTTLNNKEIMDAITVYMALKGFKIGDNFLFRTEKRKGVSVEIEVKPAKFDIEKIKDYARNC